MITFYHPIQKPPSKKMNLFLLSFSEGRFEIELHPRSRKPTNVVRLHEVLGNDMCFQTK